MSAYQAAGSLTFDVSGTEIASLAALGTVDGISVDAVGGRNGVGTAYLQIDGDGFARWKAPGGSWGPRVNVSSSGTYLIWDGSDGGKWARITSSSSFLPGELRTSRVLLRDVFDNGLAADDVTAAEASAGSTETYQVTITNSSGRRVTNVVAWLDATVANLEISDDGVAWVSPTSEGSGLALADLGPGDTDTLHLRRTISASTSSDPEVINLPHVAFDGL